MSEGIIIALIGAVSIILEAFILRKQKQSDKRQEDARERTENRKRDFVFFENTAEQGGKKPDKTPCEHLKRRPRTLPEKNI